MKVSMTVVAAGLAGWMFAAALRADDLPAGPAAAEVSAKLSEARLGELMGLVGKAGFYGLGDPEEAKAIVELRQHPEQAAPLLAKMLAEGHKNRKNGWIEVYRPMFVMSGMGPAVKVALPEIIQALEDQHAINVGQASNLLAELGEEGKPAVPALLKAWEAAKTKERSAKEQLATALLKLDAEAAKKAGVTAESE